LLASLVFGAGSASAGPRKRIVVLDFEGPQAEGFHDDLVKLIKKQHTVVPTDKWTNVATDLDASKVTEKNVKKVAKKLKIDGVVTGKIEKKRDEYIVHLKLRAGASGELVGNQVDATADEPHLSGQARKDVKDALISAIGDLSANHGGGDDDDAADAKPTKTDDDSASKKGFSKHADKGGDRVGGDATTDDDSATTSKKKKNRDDDSGTALSTKTDDDSGSSKKKAVASSDDSTTDETPRKKKKRVAASDDDGGSASARSDDVSPPRDASTYSPGNRAIDVSLGASFTARQLTFDVSTSVAAQQAPPTYKLPYPVGGAFLDLTVYPLAFAHKTHDITTDVGGEIFYDKAIHINSEAPDGSMVADTP
jgi:hypothetical protein